MTIQRTEAKTAFRKAQGMLQKIHSMLENNEYCIDIMQQNLALIGLLKSAHQSLLTGHLNSCVSGALASASPAKQRKLIDEIIRVSKLSSR